MKKEFSPYSVRINAEKFLGASNYTHLFGTVIAHIDINGEKLFAVIIDDYPERINSTRMRLLIPEDCIVPICELV